LTCGAECAWYFTMGRVWILYVWLTIENFVDCIIDIEFSCVVALYVSLWNGFGNGLLYFVLAGHTLDQIPSAIGIVQPLVLVISYEHNLG
jgi:hypothetical protein